MKKINLFLRNSFDKKIDGTGLAIFRIAYCLVLLFEITQMFYFRYLIFDKIPYIEHAEIDFGIPISIWFIAVVFILFGAFTRFFTILNYIMGLILIGSIHSYEYHVFYAYMSVNFVLMFIPINQCLSLDRLFQKLKYSNTTFTYTPSKTVSQLYYFIPTFVGVGLVYFDSIFIKLDSNSWLSGLGLWLPASMPMMVHTNASFILNLKYLMLFFGYFTLVFEAIFLFVYFRKKWRVITFFIGFFFHIGIFILWPIPWFALTVISIYLLLIPISWWQKLFSSNKDSNTLTFYYDSECPLCIRTKIIITHLDWFNKIGFKTVQFDAKENQYLKNIDKADLLDDIYSVDKKGIIYSGVDTYIQVFKRIFYLFPLAMVLKLPGIYLLAKKVYAFIAKNRTTERCTEENCGYNPPSVPEDNTVNLLNNFTVLDLKYSTIKFIVKSLFIIQLIIIYKSPVLTEIKESIGFKDTKIDQNITRFSSGIQAVTKKLFGSTEHGVFIDDHYKGYNHIIAIVYLNKKGEEIWLPIINKNGQPSYYNYGTNWRKMSFSTNNGNINIKNLNSGVRDFTAFWANKSMKIDLVDAKFLIKVKKIESLKDWKWQKDFLNKQIAKPWMDGGYIEWKDKKFISHIKDIESL
jgi:predicted DCC family thiol-disulfide oxidoreductase YuxK